MKKMYPIKVSDLELNRNNPAHIIIVDYMLRQLLGEINNALKNNYAFHSNFQLTIEGKYFLCLQSKNKLWQLVLTEKVNGDYDYVNAMKLSLKQLQSLEKDQEERMLLLKLLLPLGIEVTDKYSVTKQMREKTELN